MRFDPLEHANHDVHGDETIHYSGSISTHGNSWSVGDNRSDDGHSVVIVEGCYTCDVEFETETESCRVCRGTPADTITLCRYHTPGTTRKNNKHI